MPFFVDADWPLLPGAVSVEGADVLWPKRPVQVLNRNGDLSDEQINDVHRLLATRPW